MSTTNIAISDAATATSDSSTKMSEPPAVITQIATTMPQRAGNSFNHGGPPCLPAAYSPLERMPNEILTQICGLAVSDTKTLCAAPALALASKTIQPPAKRAMYNSIVLDDDEKSILLLRSLLQFPRNRELVRHLEVRPPVKPLRPEGPKPTRFFEYFDFSKVLDAIYEGEKRNPQLPPELLDDLKEEFDQLPGEEEWLAGEYPQGGFNTVTRAIIFLCQNIQSFKVQIMGEWSGSSCDYTRTQPRSLLAWPEQPAIAFNHLRVLDLDVASIADFSRVPLLIHRGRMCGCRVTCPPTVEDLTLRHEDASLSRNFLFDDEDDSDDDDHILRPNCPLSLDRLFKFLMPCSASLRRLRLLGGYDHAGLREPSRYVLSPQAVCKHNWNTILPHFQQLVHLEFSGYSDPCPADDEHRHTWPDNVYRYGTNKTITCLGQLPKLRYLKLPLLDLFPLSPQIFPDTVEGLSGLAIEEIPEELDMDPDEILEDPSAVKFFCTGLKWRMEVFLEELAETVDAGRGSHHNVGQKLRQAAGGEEIPRNLEKVEVYYFVHDTDEKRDPRERWAKSGQYASLSRREIRKHEARMAREAVWFPTKEKTITWTRGY